MINVIILAAGLGSRLRPITNTVPKCMVPVNEVPLIERLVNQLNTSGKDIKINIVLGYKSGAVIHHFRNSNINFILNDVYETTNNMYSLYLATQSIANLSDMVVINADCIYDDEIVKKCLNSKQSCILADPAFFNEEAMKIEVEENTVKGISKAYLKSENTFISIDMYRFIGNESHKMITYVEEVVKSGDLNSWTEVAIDAIVKNDYINMKPLFIDSYRWYEIDNHADLAIACKLFSK